MSSSRPPSLRASIVRFPLMLVPSILQEYHPFGVRLVVAFRPFRPWSRIVSCRLPSVFAESRLALLEEVLRAFL